VEKGDPSRLKPSAATTYEGVLGLNPVIDPRRRGEVPLAIDLETFSEPRVTAGKRPKIKQTPDALDPDRGEIRLITLCDQDGNILQYDLRTQQLPDHIRDALARHPLVVHNAGFDLGFLAAKLGIEPKAVFCTLTAARLLSNGTRLPNDLGAVLCRHLGIELPKDQGKTDWGAMFLAPTQLQ